MKGEDDLFGKPKTVVADDEEWVRTLVRAMLEDEPYLIPEVSHGAEAPELVNREDPDLVILDILIPKIDGLFLFYTLGGHAAGGSFQ